MCGALREDNTATASGYCARTAAALLPLTASQQPTPGSCCHSARSAAESRRPSGLHWRGCRARLECRAAGHGPTSQHSASELKARQRSTSDQGPLPGKPQQYRAVIRLFQQLAAHRSWCSTCPGWQHSPCPHQCRRPPVSCPQTDNPSTRPAMRGGEGRARRLRYMHVLCRCRCSTASTCCVPAATSSQTSSLVQGMGAHVGVQQIEIQRCSVAAARPGKRQVVEAVLGSCSPHRKLCLLLLLCLRTPAHLTTAAVQSKTAPGGVDLEQRLAVRVLQLGGLVVKPALERPRVRVHRLGPAQALVRGQSLRKSCAGRSWRLCCRSSYLSRHKAKHSMAIITQHSAPQRGASTAHAQQGAPGGRR